MRKPPGVVMCGGIYGAYDIVRPLGRAGINSMVFSSVPGDVAFRSRYACGGLGLPKFREGNFAEIFARVMASPARGAGRPALLYAGDSELMFLSRYRNQLAQSYRFVLPPQWILEALMSKVRFIELAHEADFPVPPARAFSNTAELESALEAVTLPCIVKPAYNYDWFWENEQLVKRFGSYKQALRRFDSRSDLLDFCAGLPPREAGFIVQSYIEGEDGSITSFHGYFDENSRCLGSFLTRELRTIPPGFGDPTCCETFHDERLRLQSIEYLRRIGFQGVVKIDYKRDSHDGEYKMLEIEPHYQTAHLLGACAGINLPAIAYRHLNGDAVEPHAEYRDQVRLFWFSRDLWTCVAGYRKTKEWSWARYFETLMGEKCYRLFDSADPRPFFESAVRFAGRRLDGAVGELRSRVTAPIPGVPEADR
jgi:D-aspartate ligase